MLRLVTCAVVSLLDIHRIKRVIEGYKLIKFHFISSCTVLNPQTGREFNEEGFLSDYKVYFENIFHCEFHDKFMHKSLQVLFNPKIEFAYFAYRFSNFRLENIFNYLRYLFTLEKRNCIESSLREMFAHINVYKLKVICHESQDSYSTMTSKSV